MRKVILYIAASIDGYIAKKDGDTAWLHSPELILPNEDYGYQALMDSIDSTLMGNKTYQQIMSFDIPFPYPNTTNYIFTRTAQNPTEHAIFVSENIVDFVRNLKREKGKDVWLIGGGEINTQLMNAGLVDELILSIIPIVLGTGVPLFSDGMKECGLEVTSTKNYASGLVQLTYQCKPSVV